MGDGFKDFCYTGWRWRDAVSWRKLIYDKETELFGIDSTVGQLIAHFCLKICKLGLDGLSVLTSKTSCFTQFLTSCIKKKENAAQYMQFCNW